MNAKTKAWMGTPSLIVGVALSVGTIMGWFGFRVATPEDTLQNHIDTDKAIHTQLETRTDSIHFDIHEQEELLSSVNVSLEALLRRSCLRDDYAELVLQGLIQTCTRLGAPRTPGSIGARAAVDAGLGGIVVPTYVAPNNDSIG